MMILLEALLRQLKRAYSSFPMLTIAFMFTFLGAFLNFCALFLVIAGSGGGESAIITFFVYAAYWPSLLVGIKTMDLFDPNLFGPILINLTGWFLTGLVLFKIYRSVCKKRAQ